MNEASWYIGRYNVSVLFNEPKLLKYHVLHQLTNTTRVSVLFNEPKLLKFFVNVGRKQRLRRFSALQRAEIAEMRRSSSAAISRNIVSVLFNEPKLLKSFTAQHKREHHKTFQCSSTSRNC